MFNTKDRGANPSTGNLAYPITLRTLSDPNGSIATYCEALLKLKLNYRHSWFNPFTPRLEDTSKQVRSYNQ